MVNIFITCLKIVKNFTGMKLLLVVTAIMWLYLLKHEKNKNNRIIFVYMPAIVLLIVLCPVSYFLYEKVHLDIATYYRILWIIPIGIVTVYGLVKLFSKNRKTRIIGAVLSTIILILCGSFIYTSNRIYKSTNIYAIPDDAIAVVDKLRSVDSHQRFTVLVPNVLTLYVRQYDADVCMPYGREMFDINHEYTHPVFEVFELPETIKMDELLEQTRIFEVEYIVFYAGQKTDVSPEEANLTYIDTVGNYTIYQDPVMKERVAEWEKYYPE